METTFKGLRQVTERLKTSIKKEASQLQKRNSIHGIRDASGEWQTDPGKVNFSGLLHKAFHHM